MKNIDYINNHPISIIIGLLSNLVFIFLIYVFITYSSTVTISCDRNNIQDQFCTITSSHLVYKNEEKYKLSDIEIMESKYLEMPYSDYVELSIISKKGKNESANILNGYAISVPEGKFLLAEQFNSFLADIQQKTFERAYSNTQIPYICSGLLLIFTLWSIFYFTQQIANKL